MSGKEDRQINEWICCRLHLRWTSLLMAFPAPELLPVSSGRSSVWWPRGLLRGHFYGESWPWRRLRSSSRLLCALDRHSSPRSETTSARLDALGCHHAHARRAGARHISPNNARPDIPAADSESIPQLLTFTFSGSASLKVIGVSGRSLISFLPVRSATVVPAPAPTGPPISAPVPPPASPLYASPSQ